MPRTTRVDEEGLARRLRAVELRRKRYTYDQIGAELGVSAPRAYQLWKDGVEMAPVARIEEIRDEELEFVDIAIRELLEIARSTDRAVTPRTRVEAWSAIRGWAERKARIAGIDAPKKFEQTNADGEDAQDVELRRMIDEAKAAIRAEKQATGEADA
jgi:hypothetical protein